MTCTCHYKRQFSIQWPIGTFTLDDEYIANRVFFFQKPWEYTCTIQRSEDCPKWTRIPVGFSNKVSTRAADNFLPARITMRTKHIDGSFTINEEGELWASIPYLRRNYFYPFCKIRV